MTDIEIPLAIETGALVAYLKLIAAISAARSKGVESEEGNGVEGEVTVEVVWVRGTDGTEKYHVLPSQAAMESASGLLLAAVME